ncbi:hypothetical protein GCM10010872_02270 [Dyella flava]|nr:hypothetical protein GCM10010872_02270 [Dyella flava]
MGGMFSSMYLLPMIDCGSAAMVEPWVGAMALTAELAVTCMLARVFALFDEVPLFELLVVLGPFTGALPLLVASCAETDVAIAMARHNAR